MLSTLQTRLHDDEDGFTLIELMVVVLIIAILIAIAIPTFLGVQNRAKDRAAQSDLRNALTAAKTLATDNAGSFLDNSTPPAIIDATDLKAVEGSLDFDTVANAVATGGQSKVGVFTEAAGASITLIKHSASDTFFSITSSKDGVVKYCSSKTSTDCDDGATDAANFKTKW
jgi:type IV pilus assembly protein PilA